MPRISEFYGIVIAMYYREHGVPHFHATYAGETVVVSIDTLVVETAAVVDLRDGRVVRIQGYRPRRGSKGGRPVGGRG